MPLLNLFSKKSKSPINASTSNVSLDDKEWVPVNSAVASGQQQRPQRQQLSSSSSGLPRVSNDDSMYDPPIRHSSLFPLQEEKNSVFRSTQSLPGHNDTNAKPAPHKLSSLPPLPLVSSKKSFFNWVSSKDRSHTTSSVKSASDSSDASFNLKSFRHVRPESPSFSYPSTSSSTVLPHPPSPKRPTMVPIPTSSLPLSPVSFQVTSRRPRPPPPSDISSVSVLPSSQPQSSASQITPPSRISAGVFRQAARRSATSLVLSDPPGPGLEDTNLGALLSFEDDFDKAAFILSSSPPKLPLFSFSNSTPDVSNIPDNIPIARPPRSQPPANPSNHHPSSSFASYTQANHSSSSIPSSSVAPNSSLLPATTSSGSMSVAKSTRPTPSSLKPSPVQMGRRNQFSSSSSEEESESASDDSDTGISRVTRQRTVRPRNIATNAAASVISSNTPISAVTVPGRSRAATTSSAPSRPGPFVPGVSSSQVDLPSSNLSPSTENANPLLERFPVSASTPNDVTAFSRPSPALDIHSSGGRPRASASVGALHPSAQEARASVILANARLSTAKNLSTPKPLNKPLARNAGSDTSESSESETDSDKDSDEDNAPLSKLVPPKRPGTSMSSYSTNSTSSLQKKPLVDLSTLSTFNGRPIGAPAPISREEEEMPKPKILVDTAGRSSPNLKNPSPSIRAVPSPQSQPPSQRQHGKRPLRVPLSSTSSMSSPSSSGASVATSSRGVGNASSDTSISPIDYNSKYHSFANGAANILGNSGARPDARTSPSRSSVVGLPSTSLSSAVPPTRPFLRRDSPATSSTGDSSSGRVPLTPKDRNDNRQNSRPPSAFISNQDPSRPTHGRKPSVTFEDELPSMDKASKPSGNTHPKPKENNPEVEEAKRRERRRQEARAAIELGRVVNGPLPVDDEEIALNSNAQVTWPQLGMQVPMQVPMPMPVQPMFNMGGSGGMGGMAIPPMPFPGSMLNSDPTFLAAHQQAMTFAKQAYQLAVAQQALAAANDEWERSSTMTGFMPVGGYANMGMRGSMVFPPAPASMYAGNTGGGSLINGFGGGAGAWGETRSVYGGSFGPATPTAMRLSTYSSTDLTAFNPAMISSTSGGNIANVGAGGSAQGRLGQQQRPGVRQRTKTAPSSPVPPPQGSAPPLPSPSKLAIRARAPAPPSSFRGVPNQ